MRRVCTLFPMAVTVTVVLLALLPSDVWSQCVATFTNAGGNGRWDNNANWTFVAKVPGTGCSHGTIGALMGAMSTNGTGNQGHEVVIAAPVGNNTGQPLFPIFDNLTIQSGGSLTTVGNVSIRRGGSITVEGTLNVGGNLQLNLELASDPVVTTNTQMHVLPVGTVSVVGNLHMNNWTCSGGTLVDIDGTISVGGSLTGNQLCPNGQEPVTGDGTFFLTGGCNTGGADKTACPQLCLNNLCPGGNLPVRLSEYVASWNGTAVVLDWRTESELNNSHFIVSRSFGGAIEPVARVEGLGTNMTGHNYRVVDATAPTGIVLYLLEQYDFDGTRTLLGTKEVIVLNQEKVRLKLWPSPMKAGERVTAEIGGATGAIRGTVRIVSGAGVVCHTSLFEGDLFTLQPELQSGYYYVQVQTSSGVLLSAPLVVQ